jgi:hypothetical protein
MWKRRYTHLQGAGFSPGATSVFGRMHWIFLCRQNTQAKAIGLLAPRAGAGAVVATPLSCWRRRLASSLRTASTQAGSGAAERVARLAPFTEAVDFLRDAVGMKEGSWSDEALLDSESTGEGSVEFELDQMGVVSWCCLLINDTVGIVSPGRAGVLRVEPEDMEGVGSSFESALKGDESLSSDEESSREAGDTGVRGRGVKRSSGLMHVGSCCCCCCEYKLVG